jgi:subtilisin family serine protease
MSLSTSSPDPALNLTHDVLTSKDIELAAIGEESDRVTVATDNQKLTIEQANSGDNPAFDLIGLTQLRNDPQFAGINGSGFSVAVIDTGIDFKHPLIAPNYVAGFDFIDDDPDPTDSEGHGTHVSGIVGATDEKIGVAPDAGLIGLRVLDSDGAGLITEIEDALVWVLENQAEYNITAVNLSLGIGFFTSELELQGDVISDDLQRLEDAGVTVVSAAGNDYFANAGLPNQDNLSFPAISSTIAVGAVWQDGTEPNAAWQDGSIDFSTGADRIVSFSQRLDAENVIFAPGAIINSTVPGGGIGENAGTSQASPHVAGAVALLQEASLEFSGRLLTPEEVNEVLRTTADPIQDGDDEDVNFASTGGTYFRINIYQAISEVKRRSDNIAPLPENSPDAIVSGDSNGTIAGAFVGPTVDGSPTNPLRESIGKDGINIRNNDVDIYSFQLVSPGTVDIELTSDPISPEDFDSYLQLFDASGNSIAVNNNISPENLFSRIEADLEPGTYYVGVSGNNNVNYDPTVAGSGIPGDKGNYSLEFSLNNQDPNGLISGAVDVNLGNDLEPLVFPSIIGSDFNEPVGVADVDLYRVVAPDNGALLIDIDTPYDDNFVNSFTRLFDENGKELVFVGSNNRPAENDDGLAFNVEGENVEFPAPESSGIVLDNPNQTELQGGTANLRNYTQGNFGHNTDSFLAARVEGGQVYYVGVSDFNNQDYDPNNLNNRPKNGAGGSYELIAQFVNDDINGSITQADQVTALPIVNRSEVIGRDGEQEVGDRDVDFYRLNSGESGILEIAVNSQIEDPLNSIILLFDSEGKRLGVNDQINSDDSLLRFQIAPNADYYVGVTGFGNQNFDPFALGSGTGGDTGAYTINGGLKPLSEEVNLVDNTLTSPALQNITVAETQFGNIGNDSGFIVGDADVDLYRFVPETNEAVTIQTTTREGFSADTYLRIFDLNGNEIAANNDQSELNQGSSIQLEAIAGTEYYIGVNGNSEVGRDYNPLTGAGIASGSTGNYNLSVSSGNDNISGTTVYRFFRPEAGVHFYTASEAERDTIINNLPNYAYEGASFESVGEATDPLTGAKPVYRFFNNSTGAHLYTISEAERESIANNLSNYSFEGIAYYGFEAEQPGSTPLYRFYNPNLGVHFYTPNPVERDAVLANLPDYQLESDDGIAFYVDPVADL